ncbi:hypothetical protein Cgig2_003108 [Carnegiea gigantea]|uniref:Uncharacterized protein n=1 Tax=Carnegiea gigantea TaxID=171969 RepID=A0A9Q1K0Z3_9CARY|nr:hypothetical protein Cgig2_003108 [Carnegiea gigantea]
MQIRSTWLTCGVLQSFRQNVIYENYLRIKIIIAYACTNFHRQKVRKADRVEHVSRCFITMAPKATLKEKYGRKCSRLNLMLKSRTRTSGKPINAENLANNMHAKVAMEKLKNEREQGLNDKTDEQIFQEVLGKDTHGYLHAYGRGKSITDYFGVKPSRLDLAQDVMELKKRADESVVEAKKDVEEARKEAEHAKLEAEQVKKEAKEARKVAEATRQEVDAKIEVNNKMWEKKMKNMLEEFLRSSTHEVTVPQELLWLKEYIVTGTLVARSRFAMGLPWPIKGLRHEHACGYNSSYSHDSYFIVAIILPHSLMA